MRRLFGLSTLLIGMNVGLVLVVIVCVLVAAVGRLRRLADESALARARVAAAGALERVERSADGLAASARLLAENPTLAPHPGRTNTPALTGLLDRFHRTSHLTGCAVLDDGSVI